MLYARENWLKDRQAFVVWHASIKTKGSCKRRFVPKSEVEEFIEGAMLLMNVVGIKIFEDTNTILRNRLINRTRKKRLKPLNIWNQMMQSSQTMSTIIPTQRTIISTWLDTTWSTSSIRGVYNRAITLPKPRFEHLSFMKRRGMRTLI